jgi:hypothetical protein
MDDDDPVYVIGMVTLMCVCAALLMTALFLGWNHA